MFNKPKDLGIAYSTPRSRDFSRKGSPIYSYLSQIKLTGDWRKLPLSNLSCLSAVVDMSGKTYGAYDVSTAGKVRTNHRWPRRETTEYSIPHPLMFLYSRAYLSRFLLSLSSSSGRCNLKFYLRSHGGASACVNISMIQTIEQENTYYK